LQHSTCLYKLTLNYNTNPNPTDPKTEIKKQKQKLQPDANPAPRKPVASMLRIKK